MGTRRLKLRNMDKYLICDNKDYANLSKYRWYGRYNRPGGNLYAVAFVADARGSLRNIYAHRLVMNAQPGEMIDHSNHNSLDCRRSNLRFATHATNARNAAKNLNRANLTSDFKGVSRLVLKDGSIHWRARIYFGGRTLNFGSHGSERAAARAYDEAARELFGEFARTNFNGNIRVRVKVA